MQSITVEPAVERYLAEVKPLLRSYYSVVSVLRNFSAFFPDRALSGLRSPDIHGYVQSRLSDTIRRNTVNRELSVISAMINHAIRKWGVEMTNPVRWQWLKPDPLRLRYLQKSEATALVEHARALRPDLADFITVALHTGCRKTELILLQWRDVDLDKGFMILRPENTKTARWRLIPLNSTAVRVLRDRKAGNDSEWVFTKPNGKRAKTYDDLFRKAVKAAGIEDFRIHDLRHTFASWLVSEGVELVKVRDLLGHASIKMTERYAHLMPDRLRSAVEVLTLF